MSVSWDAPERLLRIAFVRQGTASDEARAELARQVRAWTAGDECYHVLAGCGPDTAPDLRWRLFWARLFEADLHRARIACYGLTLTERFMLGTMRGVFRMNGTAFATEADALAHLRAQPAPAKA